MRVDNYLAVAHKTDRLPKGDIKYEINPRLGLAGEVGYLLTQLKKEVREDRPTANATRAAIKDELGDILWYSATIARRAGVGFQKNVLFQNLVRVQTNYSEGNMPPAPLLKSVLRPGGEVSEALKKGPSVVETFGNYQKLAVRTSKYKKDRKALVPYLVQIWSNAGELLEPFGAFETEEAISPIDKESVARSLGDIMWYVAGFAHLYNLNLDEIAESNKEKILSAFPARSQRFPTPLYDDDKRLGPLERFPRRFNVDFVEFDSEIAVMLINGVRVGDPLTDNAYTTENGDRELIDGYRFHDSIHLAFVAILGWSPVIRSLMKLKRKSQKEIDEVEDGARARIVEEMIVKIAHSHAVGHHRDKLLDGKKHINLNLLKDIKVLAEGLEVAGGRKDAESCKYWEWEQAILKGFKIYNQLRRNRRGRIIVDLNKRSVKFTKLKKSQGTRMPITNP